MEADDIDDNIDAENFFTQIQKMSGIKVKDEDEDEKSLKKTIGSSKMVQIKIDENEEEEEISSVTKKEPLKKIYQ